MIMNIPYGIFIRSQHREYSLVITQREMLLQIRYDLAELCFYSKNRTPHVHVFQLKYVGHIAL